MKLRCGCTNGIPFSHWLVCPQHDHPEFVEYVRRYKKGEWFRLFRPNTKGRRPQVPYV